MTDQNLNKWSNNQTWATRQPPKVFNHPQDPSQQHHTFEAPRPRSNGAWDMPNGSGSGGNPGHFQPGVISTIPTGNVIGNDQHNNNQSTYPMQAPSGSLSDNKGQFGIPFGEMFGGTQGAILTGIVQNAVMEGTNSVLKEMGMGDTSNVMSTMELLLPNKVQLLKRHFNVSHEYVAKKSIVLLCPFLNNFITFNGISQSDSLDGLADPRDILGSHEMDGHSTFLSIADLYLPLISMLSYVLLCGCQKGSTSQFHPDVLQYYLKFGGLSWIIESALGLVAYSMVAPYSDLAFITVLSIAGYKFLHINTLIFASMLIPSYIPFLFWAVFIYLTYACSHSTYLMITSRSLDIQNQLENDYSGAAKREFMRKKVAVTAAVHGLLQILLLYFLNPAGLTMYPENPLSTAMPKKLGGPGF